MPVVGEINAVNVYERAKIYEDTSITWKISKFFTTVNTTEKYLDSPRFQVGDEPFFLRLFPKSRGLPNSKECCIILKSNVIRSYNVDYTFHIKKSDGTDEDLASGRILSNQKFGRKKIHLSIQDMMQRKQELLDGKDLCIKGLLKPDTFASNQEQNSHLKLFSK